MAKNFLLNLTGQGLPFVAAIFAIPYLVRGMGAERFGILSIAWVVLGYSSVFNFGLSRATTKYVAEYIGKGQTEQLPHLIWTSALLQGGFGLLGGVILAAVSPLLAERLFRISPALQHEALLSFLLMAIGIPMVLIGAGFRGVLQAVQRFDLVNLVKVPANTGLFLLPALAVAWHRSLAFSIALITVLQLMAAIAYLLLALRVVSSLGSRFGLEPRLLRPLLSYGGWITVSNVLIPAMMYMDRFVIGAVLSVSSLAFYTAPFDAITRAAVVPGALTATLFPAISSLNAAQTNTRVVNLCLRSLKFILLVLCPVLLVVVAFARDILRFWLSVSFASHSTAILQVLAIGTFLNCLAYVPSSLLDGVGRPDVSAKLHLYEFPIYAAVLVALLLQFGVLGAAIAWTLRVGADAILLFVAAARLHYLPAPSLLRDLRRAFTVLSLWTSTLLLSLSLIGPLGIRAAVSGLYVVLLGLVAWKYALDEGDRTLASGAAARIAFSLLRRQEAASSARCF